MDWIKPPHQEYAEHYANYVRLVPEGNLTEILEKQIADTVQFLRTLPEEKLKYRYAEGKWTIKQIVQHMVDAERIFAYRLLRIARNDKTPMPGFEENEYADEAHTENRSFEEQILEFETLRKSTLFLIKSLHTDELMRTGTASNAHISARALCYIIAGHELHHCAVINERYL